MSKFGNVYSLLLVLVCTALISACGFQLRGKVTLPAGVEPLYIAGIDSGEQLAVELRTLLSAQGVKLSSNAKDANYQLVILQQRKDRRSAALADGARVAEYQLTEIVDFELLDTKGRRVFGPSSITERKIMPNDPNKVVSTSEEEQLLRREMLQNMAAKIARQLQSVDYSTTPVSTQ